MPVSAAAMRDGVSSAAAESSSALRHWRIPGILLIALAIFVLRIADSISKDQWWVPGILIGVSGLVLIPAIHRTLRQNPQQVLADHFLVLAGAYLLYDVFGALLIPFGPQDQAEYALSFYSVDAQMAMRVTAVHCIGLGVALVSGSLIGRRLLSKWAGTAARFGASIPQEVVIILFLFVGGISALYVLRFELSLQPGVVSGIFRMLSSLLLVAVMMAAAHRGRGSRSLLVAAVVLTALQALGALLLLSKWGVLLPIVALFAGLVLRFGARRVALPAVVILAAAFLLIGNPVNTARNISPQGSRVDWDNRTEVLREGVLDPRRAQEEEGYQFWARLCYLPAQGAAMELFDGGRGGEDYTRVGWAFLPRVLFPDKPNMTSSGTEFNDKITGRDSSSTGQGVFVDGYYNLGWWGVVAVGLAVGLMLAWTSAVAAVVYRARVPLWLPIALMGSLMASRIDGSFLGDYWGPFVLWAYVVFGVALIQTLISRRARA